MLQPVSRIVDLLDPALNRICNMTVDEARRRVLDGDPAGVRGIDGSFALVAAEGVTVRLARSLDRPMRYFLAKRHEGPALYVADRIDTLHHALADRRPRGSVPPELHAHGPGPLRRRDRARRLSGSRSRSTRASSRRDRTRCRRRSTRSAAGTSARWRTRSRSGCGRSTPARRAGADRRRVFRRHRQRRGLPRDLPRDAPARPVAARLKAFVLNLGAGPGRRSGARVSVGGRACRSSSRRSTRRPTVWTSTRRSACSRTTSRSTSSARRWASSSAAASAPATPSGAISPTATAATRTSRTIRSKRTPS